MGKLTVTTVLACLTVFANSVLAATSATDAADTFTILHTNDIHGRYMPFRVVTDNATSQTGDHARPYQEYAHAGMVGGFAYMATAIKGIRQEKGEDNVILVNAGDTFSDDLLGNLTKGAAIISLMNSLGYQFMALGNHDFDYGLPRTRELQRLADFPMRGANIIDDATGQPLFGEPFKFVNADGVKVALLALGYHNTGLTGNKAHFEGIHFTSGIEAARAYVPQLRKHADVVVVVSHQGTQVDLKMARQFDGIDIIIGGHSHDGFTKPVKIGDTWIVQALSDASALGQLEVTVKEDQVTDVGYKINVLWNEQITPDPATESLTSSLRAPYESQLTKVIAQAAEAIGRNYRSNSPFDVLAGEILIEATGADIAMLPGVGYGVTLDPGPITREELYSLMPHPSRMVTVDLSGQQLVQLLEQSATNNRPVDPMNIVGGLIQTAGMHYVVDYGKPVGKRISQVTVHGKPIRADGTYTVVTHNGMMGGVHNYLVLQQGSNIVNHHKKITDVVEAYFHEHGEVSPPEQSSVTIIDSAKRSQQSGTVRLPLIP